MAKKIVPATDEAVGNAASSPEKKVPVPKKTVVKTASAGSKKSKAIAAKPETASVQSTTSEQGFIQPEIIQPKPVEVYSLFSEFDISLFKAGKHYKLYQLLGSHTLEHKGVTGTYFAVWAPNAQVVYVMGNFNGWNKTSHQLFVRWDGSGIWEGFIPNVGHDETYKYAIRSFYGEELEKGDPFALRWEEPPRTASIVTHTYFEWNDQDWMQKRMKNNALTSPYSVYEVHFGSWARSPESPDQFLNYRQMAEVMVKYVKDMGFTHVEFMPLAEHPYYPSWGYQITGYFAASTRYGSPQDLMYLVSEFHKADIGVILDWVPSHFPGDAHGLFRFDGTSLYEHENPEKGFHPDWKSYIFNYGRNEVKSFLISNALFWLDRYHIDGLRVDAVASMLYLDYSRKAGEWEPNIYGGNENLEAIQFLKEFNEAVYSHYPDVQTIAEESTSFGGVSKPTFMGGLGFGMKWMMGWMHDTINFFKEDPINRKYHHKEITFSLLYAFTENFMLPLSHDEVVYGKNSMINKMPGDEWQRFANLRTLYSYMFTHPGTKLLFMGDEFAQIEQWEFGQSLDWHLLEHRPHKGMQDLIKALNDLYKTEPALHEKAFTGEGFEWIDEGNAQESVLIYARKGILPENDLVIVLNFTPVIRENFRIGVPQSGNWKEIFNSDDLNFWGSGTINPQEIPSEDIFWNYKNQSVALTLPPLGVTVLKKVG
jgi:1,4-alpha-glucan branching enzyme